MACRAAHQLSCGCREPGARRGCPPGSCRHANQQPMLAQTRHGFELQAAFRRLTASSMRERRCTV